MFSKHQHLQYNDRIVSADTWSACGVLSVHLDDGPSNPYYSIKFFRNGEAMEKQTQPDRLRVPPPRPLTVKIVYIENLMNHLGKGWTEEQLVSGKVNVLGREELTFLFPPDESATVTTLALKVLDEWGSPLADQTYKFNGRALQPSTRADGETNLRTLFSGGGELVMLLSAGRGEDNMGGNGGESGGLKTKERMKGSATMQVSAHMWEQGGRAVCENAWKVLLEEGAVSIGE